MATSSQSSVDQGSHEVKDYICNACEDHNNVETSAEFYCKQCDRFYCGNCIEPHGKVFAKHTAFGRVEKDKWPVSKKVVDFLQTCDEHMDHKIDKFCNIHRQLCCPQCVSNQHSKCFECIEVIPIYELTNPQPTDLQGLSAKLETVLKEIKSLQSSQEASIKSLQGTYKEHGACMIEQMRVNINATVDECGNSSVSTSDENEDYLKEEMCRSVLPILNEFDNSTVKELKEFKDEHLSIKDSITSSIQKFTVLQNALTQLYDTIHKIGNNKELFLIASIKCEHKIKQAMNMLGKSGPVLTVQGKSDHNVRIPSDKYKPYISAICVLHDGQVLVADWNNHKVKLLDQQFQVVSHLGVPASPHDICLITPTEVAVVVNDSYTQKVQFIRVTQSQLVTGSKLKLQHYCSGIAHHQGDLFICSATALYKYSLSGKLVCRLYKDKSPGWTVDKCAVSPTGDKLYIPNYSNHKLLTLARDGKVLAEFTDPALINPSGIHVTPAGQVLVCGPSSNTILQVDSEGRRKLAILATRKDGMREPLSVCYNRHTASIIVGLGLGSNILVFRVE